MTVIYRCRSATCHRRLVDEDSVSRGYGPVCWRRIFGTPPPRPRATTSPRVPVAPIEEIDDQVPLFELEVTG